MRNFKNFLLENTDAAHAWLEHKIATKKITLQNNYNYDIEHLHAKTWVLTKSAILKEPVPVKFDYVNKILARECKYFSNFSQLNIAKACLLEAERNDFETFENCPIGMENVVVKHSKLKSITGLGPKIRELTLSYVPDFEVIDENMPMLERFWIWDSGLKSIQGIQKKCPSLKDLRLHLSPYITGPILGLLLIKPLEPFLFSSVHEAHEKTDLEKAFTIVNNYLKGERDLIDCKEELIASGLKDYAKL